MDAAERKLRKEYTRISVRALNKAIRIVKREPSRVEITWGAEADGGAPTDGITSWLFQRREDNGSARS